jgi:hypothetical protein
MAHKCNDRRSALTLTAVFLGLGQSKRLSDPSAGTGVGEVALEHFDGDDDGSFKERFVGLGGALSSPRLATGTNLSIQFPCLVRVGTHSTSRPFFLGLGMVPQLCLVLLDME